jgi:S1-C subfamily serine protease
MTQTRQWLPYSLLVLGMMCAYIFATIASSAPAHADSIPGGNVADPVVRSVDIARPAVVRILTRVSATLSVNFPSGSVTFPQQTGKEYQGLFSGTGTLITSKGDILTADHVVTPPAEAFYDDPTVIQDITNYINQHPNVLPGQGQVTAAQVLQLLQSNQLQATDTLSNKQSVAFLSTDYSGPLTVTDINNVPDSLRGDIQIEKESAFDQKDVAIVHANFPIADLSFVQLGDSSTVQSQDQLTIIGFPGNGDVSNQATDLLTSSVNKITVSSIKKSDNGAQLIQVGGNVEQGDSGGPALNSNGVVVGVVSFGAIGSGSTSFLQASNSARDLLQTLKLDTKTGAFQTQWAQAFNDYAASTPGHWHKAAQEFQQLATSYPQFKAITPYLNYAQTQAKSEKTTAPAATPESKPQSKPQGSALSGTLPALALTFGSVILLILLVALLFGVIMRQRKKQLTQGAPGQSTSRGQPQRAQARPAQASTPGPAQPPLAQMPPASSATYGDGMSAFGAPSGKQPTTRTPVPPSPSLPTTPQGTLNLRIWPCGHMNRSNARFCSICGEPAPEPPTIIRRIEQ